MASMSASAPAILNCGKRKRKGFDSSAEALWKFSPFGRFAPKEERIGWRTTKRSSDSSALFILEAHRACLQDFTKRKPIAWFSSGTNSTFYGVQIEPA